jgi:hypothetical protein
MSFDDLVQEMKTALGQVNSAVLEMGKRNAQRSLRFLARRENPPHVLESLALEPRPATQSRKTSPSYRETVKQIYSDDEYMSSVVGRISSMTIEDGKWVPVESEAAERPYGFEVVNGTTHARSESEIEIPISEHLTSVRQSTEATSHSKSSTLNDEDFGYLFGHDGDMEGEAIGETTEKPQPGRKVGLDWPPRQKDISDSE